MRFPRALTSLVLVSLLLSTLALGAPAGVAAASGGGPPGLDGVPAENVGPPDHANAPDHAGPPSDAGPPGDVPTSASAWRVHASDHAADLTVEVGSADGELALTVADAENHAGREVAVDAATLEDAVGHRPEVAHGVHSSGERWSAEVRYVDGFAVLDVPHFSENTVTFDATVSIEATPAVDGDTFRYNVSDADAVENVSVTLTGEEATAEETAAGRLADGGSVPFDVDGTTAPRNATLTVEEVTAASGGDPVLSADRSQYADDSAFDPSSGVVYYVDGRNVVAWDYETGSTLWTADSATFGYDSNLLGIAYGDGELGIVSASDAVHVLDAADGSTLNTHKQHTATPQDVVYRPSNSSFYTIATDGEVRRTSATSTATVESYAVTADDASIDVGPSGELLAGFGGSTGDALRGPGWSYSGYADVDAVREAGGVAYVAGDADGSVTALNLSDGSVLWSHTGHGGEVRDVAVSEGIVYSAGSPKVVAADAENGSVLWSHNEHDGNLHVPEVEASNGVVYSAAYAGGQGGEIQGYAHELRTTDPTVSVGGETVVDVSGQLAAGETITENVSLALGESGDVAVSTSQGTEADVSLSWVEVTETTDPTVSVNGNTAGVSGVLADGETASVNVSETWIGPGENVVEVTASPNATGPAGTVGLSYSHDAVEERAVSYSASTWSERYNVSKTWGSDVETATLSVPWASDRVVDVRNLTVTVDGVERDVGSSVENGTLTVDVGAVGGGETVEVEAVGSKVRAVNGSIRVVNATTPAERLDAEVEVLSAGDGFGIDVTGTDGGHLLHYAAAESWSGASSTSVVDATGRQVLETNAPDGGTLSVRSVPVEISVEEGAVEATVSDTDPAAPRFYVGEHNGSDTPDRFEVAYHRVETGETWDLVDVDNLRTVDTSTASSPVWFTAPVEGLTYTVERVSKAPAEGAGVAAIAGSGGGGGLDLSATAVLLASAVSVLGILAAGRRFGVSSRRGYAALAGAASIVGVVGVEAVTNGSVIALTVEAVLSPVSGAPAAGTVVLGLLLLLGLVGLHLRFGLPAWFLAVSGGGVSVWVLDAVTGGALAGGLSEVSPALWLLGILGAFVLLYRRLSPRDIVLPGER